MPTRDSYEPGRPCWVDLGTTDPEAARAFYGELFGWTAEVDPRPEAGGYAMFNRNGQSVAGVGPLFAEGMPPVWSTYIATDDVDATAKTVGQNGGTVMMEPMDVLDVGRMAMFAGPDGAVAGLWQPRAHTGAKLVNEPGSWSWSALATRDKPGAMAFYGALFGWNLKEDPNWGEYIALGDKGEVASVMEMGSEFPPQVPPHWQVVFMVDDVDAAMAEAQRLGGSTHGPARDGAPGMRTGALADPQGAQFGVLSFDPSQVPS